MTEAFLNAGRRLVERGAEIICPSGLAYIPIRVSANEVSQRLGIPVLDPGLLSVRTAEMPPSRYTLMHSESRLSRREREQLYRWTSAERSRIRRDGPSGLTPVETGLRPPFGH